MPRAQTLNIMYFDSHTHINFDAFKDDWRGAISRSLENGVAIITSGTQKDTSRRAVEVAHEFPENVWASVGLHPIHTDKSFHDEQELGGGDAARAFTSRGEKFDREFYKNLAQDPKVVAIGECGLDYYRISNIECGISEEEKKQKQKNAFLQHLKLAHEVGKPLVIHCRKAVDDVLKILEGNKNLLQTENPGIAHFYTDGIEGAKKLLDLGFAFSIGGVITFTRDYDEMIKMIPMERILTETDSPYVAPVPYRGKRNEPAYVIEVVKKLANIKGVSAEEMKSKIWENAKRIFKLTG